MKRLVSPGVYAREVSNPAVPITAPAPEPLGGLHLNVDTRQLEDDVRHFRVYRAPMAGAYVIAFEDCGCAIGIPDKAIQAACAWGNVETWVQAAMAEHEKVCPKLHPELPALPATKEDSHG